MNLRTILVCDDHPTFRLGVIASLEQDPVSKVIGEATDGEACIAKLKLFNPDILIVDLSMPGIDGFGVLEWVQRNSPGVRVFMLSMYSDVSFVQKAMELGACGFLAKEDARSELLEAIRTEPGVFYTSESVGHRSQPTKPGLHDHDVLRKLRSVSDAEMKVLTLLTNSMTSREIADELCLSVRTIQAHRVNLANKLDLKGPNKLLDWAIRYQDAILNS